MVRKLTNEDIVQKIFELVGGEYTKLDNVYVNNSTKFKIKHNPCGHEYEVRWNAFQQGARCPKCAGVMKLTNEDIIQKIFELVGDEYTKLDNKYVRNDVKFKIRHNVCGHEYKIAWTTFQQGNRCPKCSGLMKLTNEEVKQRIFELVGDEYTKLDDSYINAITKFKIRHNTCGHEYEVSWNSFQKGYRCPCCNQSKGEKFIEDYLTNHNISFATQVRFDDCRHRLPLPFDFGILNSENEVVALLEFDGQQHFEPIEAWGGEENLKEVQLRDRVKDDYCKEHKIPLLRIRYDEENILKVIEEFIAQEKVS